VALKQPADLRAMRVGQSVVILGGAVTALLYAALMWRRRRQSRDHAG